jgi:DNA polymerase IV
MCTFLPARHNMDQQKPSKHIIHLDMDAFYPSVEVLDNPDLKGKPVIVGGSKERGVVSSASYEARKFGVHSAQPMATAMQLCPHGIVMPTRMSRYKEVSVQVFEIFDFFTPLVEPLSIDEAFLDVTDSIRLFGSPIEIAKRIKLMVTEKTGLTISAGVAPSKFVAKIASDMEKPDGLTVVSTHKVRAFLDPLPIKKMWGVGKVTQEALSGLRIHTFKDLSHFPVEVLEKKFGKHGSHMHQLSRGIDERDVVTGHDVKSIGHEDTYSKDIFDLDLAKRELLSLANRVARRMRRKGFEGKTITLKVKYHDFVRITRSVTRNKYTNDSTDIYANICNLLEKTAVGKKPVRLLGISLSNLAAIGSGRQLSLFKDEGSNEKRKELNKTLDSVLEKFGSKGIRPGSLIDN